MKVSVKPYDPLWRSIYQQHHQLIIDALSSFNPTIDHIGSTSLASIAAKPIIDILVGLPDESQLDAVITPMLEAGYTYFEKFTPAMAYRRFFAQLQALSSKPLPKLIGTEDHLALGKDYNTTVNIHVMVKDTLHWVRHIAFRDYLITFPEVRADYEALKLEIAEMDFDDPLEYNHYKEAFITEYQAKALDWYFSRNARGYAL